jgi:hypothetical protein
MWRDKATGAKKCLNRYISQHFFAGCFPAKQGHFVIPWKCVDSSYQSSSA